MSETLFEELRRYVDFSEQDQAALRQSHPLFKPHFVHTAEVFYDRILSHEGARKALVGGESSVGHLKITLVAWMDSLLQGPWDESYYERRAKIGRLHVRIALPQHYMFGAMNVVRRAFGDLTDQLLADQPEERPRFRRAFNKILDLELAIMLHTYREDLLAQQARTERLSTFGQLVGSIGHELRNPLGVIESSVYLLNKVAAEEPRVQKHVQRIGEQVEIASHIITDLLDMIRDRPLQLERVALGEAAREACAAVAPGPGQTVELHGLEALGEVQGDRGQLRQVFVNLVENAVQAAGERGEISVVGERQGHSLEVSVEDSGPGVSPAVRARLFEPLMTTKSRGIGLGLALVKRIVERHGGTITYSPGTRGARFVVRIPQA